FLLVSVAWIFFRAENLTVAMTYIIKMFVGSGDYFALFLKSSKMILLSTIIVISISVMLIFEFIALKMNKTEVSLSQSSSIFVLLLILFMGAFKNPENFIYFQF